MTNRRTAEEMLRNMGLLKGGGPARKFAPARGNYFRRRRLARMNLFKAMAFSTAVAVSACGVPMEGEEDALLTETAQQELGSCEQGDDANYLGYLYGSNSSAGYSRPESSYGGPCRDTTIVDFDGYPNTRYRFVTSAVFEETPYYFLCSQAVLALRTLRQDGSSWVEVDYREVRASWNGSGCSASVAHVLTSDEYAASGNYRVRAKAKNADGSSENLSITGSNW